MVHIAQDHDKIYITFPKFTKGYSQGYSTDKAPKDLKNDNFLILQEYGPFSLTSKSDMTEVADFIRRYTKSVEEKV